MERLIVLNAIRGWSGILLCIMTLTSYAGPTSLLRQQQLASVSVHVSIDRTSVKTRAYMTQGLFYIIAKVKNTGSTDITVTLGSDWAMATDIPHIVYEPSFSFFCAQCAPMSIVVKPHDEYEVRKELQVSLLRWIVPIKFRVYLNSHAFSIWGPASINGHQANVAVWSNPVTLWWW